VGTPALLLLWVAVYIQAMNEILSPQQMNECDRRAIAAGIKSTTLMENAGFAVTREIRKRFKKCPTAVLCGPGNNGGDGFVVARLLKRAGWPVRVFLIGSKGAFKSDARTMAAKWKGNIEPYANFTTFIGGRSGVRLIVDAIYGAGLNREFPGAIADDMHGTGVPIVAIDVPSGVDGKSGQQRGASLIADLTVTFCRKKPAHVLEPGRRLCGELVVADIGVPDAIVEDMHIDLHENQKPALPILRSEMHKYKRGHAVVWSGPELATGASRLTAWAAARVGAGLTSLAGTPDALRIHATHVSSIMLKPCDGEKELGTLLQDQRVTTFCIGPAAGVGEKTKQLTLRSLQAGPPIVLDADALSSFVDDAPTLFAAIKSRPERPVVLTPHEGEFARLFKSLASDACAKHERAIEAANRSGAIVVLKGPDTIIAAPSGRAVINTNAPAKLATAGSGDVLAGLVAGLLAQNMDPFGATCAAVWLHGDAANRINRRNIVAEDLIDAIGLQTETSVKKTKTHAIDPA
jgi:ADP-dependent NAD(P)H-hydrate dehydratase / NAD(P)H-hydrate epimerase